MNTSNVIPFPAICPRCAGFIPSNERPGAYRGALSRTDNETEVCSACGDVESFEDCAAWKAAGEPPHYVKGCSKLGWLRPDAARSMIETEETAVWS